MSGKESIEQLGQIVGDIADSMTKVATNIAMLGVTGSADEQMRTITEENNKVLNRIRCLYNIPDLPDLPERSDER